MGRQSENAESDELKKAYGGMIVWVFMGDKGAGKSALLHSIALSLGLHNGPDTLRLLLIDLSGPGRWGSKGGRRARWSRASPSTR